eukprot:COSAG04_NODE_631_length_11736_cov_11.237690_12_plen_100_part_00
MDEATMTQLSNGSVMVNMRHTASKTLGRGVSVSHDNGATFGPISYDKTLISPVCQASLVTISGVTYFSNPESTTGASSRVIPLWLRRCPLLLPLLPLRL